MDICCDSKVQYSRVASNMVASQYSAMHSFIIFTTLLAVAYSACPPGFRFIDEVPEYFAKVKRGAQLRRRKVSYEVIETTGKYTFNGRSYSEITINANGYILFGNYSVQPYAYPWNITKPIPYDMAAIFYAVSDISDCGRVFYKETWDRRSQKWFRTVIRKAFGYKYWNFLPNSILTVTYFSIDSWYLEYCDWDKRRDVEAGDEIHADGPIRPDPKVNSYLPIGLNTYQIVVGSTGEQTFVVYNYGCISWTDDGFSTSGFYNRVDGSGYLFNASLTSHMEYVMDHGTNDNGQYVFRVDPSDRFIEDPHPESTWYA